MRVLKPGGVLASREMITEASFVGPEEAVDDVCLAAPSGDSSAQGAVTLIWVGISSTSS